MLMVYVNAMGGKLRFTILMSWFLLVELCRVGATVWLSYWTGIADKPGECVLQTTSFARAGLAMLTTMLHMCSGIYLCRSCVLKSYARYDKAHVFALSVAASRDLPSLSQVWNKAEMLTEAAPHEDRGLLQGTCNCLNQEPLRLHWCMLLYTLGKVLIE